MNSKIRQDIKGKGSLGVVFLLLCFILVSCDASVPQSSGPRNPPPVRVKDAIAHGVLVRGGTVYQKGMPGLIEKSLDRIKALRQSMGKAKVTPLLLASLKLLHQESLQEHQKNVASFQATTSRLREGKFPAVALERWKALEQAYTAKYIRFQQYFKPLLVEAPEKLRPIDIARFAQFLESVQPQDHSSPFDPSQLPHHSPQSVAGTPLMSAAAFARKFDVPVPTAELPKPSAKDLAETTDVQFTPEIKALAAKLKTPYAIYKWVYDNVEYHPTYGSIQGADYCRQTLKCNAFDTSSLLIALLRAQNIHARYVFGTVELPLDKARNWVGFSDPTQGPAGRVLASGGIRTKLIEAGGKAVAVQFEHVWVEAFVDYVPSRGRIHRKGDNWIPLDASYKQFVYTKGTLDLEKAGGLDQSKIKQLLQQSVKTAKTDALGGLIKAPDTKAIEQALTAAKDKAIASLKAQKKLNLAKLLGSKRIIPFHLNYLPSVLASRPMSGGLRQVVVPDKLRYTITIKLTTKTVRQDLFTGRTGGAPDFSVTLPLPHWVGKRLTLAYEVAREVDKALVERYITSIEKDSNRTVRPALLELKPVLLLETKRLAVGKKTLIGRDSQLVFVFKGPGLQRRISNVVVTGAMQAIVLNPGALSFEQIQKRKTSSEGRKRMIEDKKPLRISSKTVLSEFLHSTGESYWGHLQIQRMLDSRQNRILMVRLPSVGLFSSEMQAHYSGFLSVKPKSVEFSGFATDVDHDSYVVISYDYGTALSRERAFRKRAGMHGSIWESYIWSLALREGRRLNPDISSGISTMHALEHAIRRGIPVYTLNQSNWSKLSGKLSLPRKVFLELRSSVLAGKVVVIPQRLTLLDGWLGVGYQVLDPVTGAGAYRISGGKNGALALWRLIKKSWKGLSWGGLLLSAAAIGNRTLSYSIMIHRPFVDGYLFFGAIDKVEKSRLSNSWKFLHHMVSILFLVLAMAIASLVFLQALPVFAGVAFVLFSMAFNSYRLNSL